MKKEKLIMFGMLVFLTITLVSAATYYILTTVTLNINQPISVIGDGAQSINCVAGFTCLGTQMSVSNDGPNSVEVIISDDSDLKVNVSYIGTLELTKKIVDFTLDKWVTLDGDDKKVQIEYTVVSDKFSAEITDDNEETEYVLIYYADNADRFANTKKAILVENISENLPYVIDENAEGGDYNYCDLDEYITCHGAKIWYVPRSAINTDGTLDWSRANEFYFESSLIQYNMEGNIIVYPNETLNFIPKFNIDKFANETPKVVTIIVN